MKVARELIDLFGFGNGVELLMAEEAKGCCDGEDDNATENESLEVCASSGDGGDFKASGVLFRNMDSVRRHVKVLLPMLKFSFCSVSGVSGDGAVIYIFLLPSFQHFCNFCCNRLDKCHFSL